MALTYMQGKLLRVNIEGTTLIQAARSAKFRYYRLEGSRLKQYRSEKEKEPLRQIQIEPGSSVCFLTVDSVNNSSDPSAEGFFRIAFPNTSKLDFQCTTQNDCFRWVQAIKDYLESNSTLTRKEEKSPFGLNADISSDISQEDSFDAYVTSTPESALSSSLSEEKSDKSRWSVQHGGTRILRIFSDRHGCAVTSKGSEEFKIESLGLSFALEDSGYLQITGVEPSNFAGDIGRVDVGDIVYAVNGKDIDSHNWEEPIYDIVGSSATLDFLVGPKNITDCRRTVTLNRKLDIQVEQSNESARMDSDDRKTLTRQSCVSIQSSYQQNDVSGLKYIPHIGQEYVDRSSPQIVIDAVNVLQATSTCEEEKSSAISGQKTAETSNQMPKTAEFGNMSSNNFRDNQTIEAFSSQIPHSVLVAPFTESSGITSATCQSSISPGANLVPTISNRNHVMSLPMIFSTQYRCASPDADNVEQSDKLRSEYKAGQRDEIERRSAPKPEVMEFNIGGRVFMTTYSTISRAANCLLAMIMDKQVIVPTDVQGIPFIDRDPDLFEPILEYLRHGIIQKFENLEDLKRAHLEAVDYGIPDLYLALEQQMNLFQPAERLEEGNHEIFGTWNVQKVEQDSEPQATNVSGALSTTSADEQNLIFHSSADRVIAKSQSHLQDHARDATKFSLKAPSDSSKAFSLTRGKRRVDFNSSNTDPAVLQNSADVIVTQYDPKLQSIPRDVSVKDHSPSIKPILKTRNGGSSSREAELSNHGHRADSETVSKVPFFREIQVLSFLLSRFYLAYSPYEAYKVTSIVQDYTHRGGGKKEFEYLNDCLRKKFGVDLGSYERNFRLDEQHQLLSGRNDTQTVNRRTRLIKLTRRIFDGTRARIGLLLQPVGPAKEIEIAAIAPRSPAFFSGEIFVGEKIRSINGANIQGLSLQTVTAMLAGPAGTTVTLEIEIRKAVDDSLLDERTSSKVGRSSTNAESNPAEIPTTRNSAEVTRHKDLKAKNVSLEIISARNFPSELQSLSLYCTAEVRSNTPVNSSQTMNSSMARKFPYLNPRTKAVTCQGFDGEMISWNANRTLEFVAVDDQVVVRLWAKSQRAVGTASEPMHAGCVSIVMSKILQDQFYAEARWFALKTLNGRQIVRAPKKALELQLAFKV